MSVMGSQEHNPEEEMTEFCRLFPIAVRSQDSQLAESLILGADPQSLNDALCMALSSIWFLRTQQQLFWLTELIKKIIANGANDFTTAAQGSSFIASCLTACCSRTTSLEDTATVMDQRLQEHLQQSKAVVGAQTLVERSLKFIGFHSGCQDNKERVSHTHSSVVEIQLQLSAFKTFLDLAGNKLTGKDFRCVFDMACVPLMLFSCSFDPGWASTISTTAIRGLLDILVEGGADNVDQCFLKASHYGSTELVRFLLQTAQRNNLDIDVDHAFDIASNSCKISTMEFLAEEDNEINFLDPLMTAAERGCMQVVEWFVKRGCQDMELCLALEAATSSSQVGAAAYLLPHIPQDVLAARSIEILTATGELCGGSLDGVAFLLRSDFLGDPAATYAVADSIARSNDEDVAPELRAFLQENWSEAAFLDGRRQGRVHYMNLLTILKWSESPTCYSGKKTKKSATCLRDLPGPLRVAIAYRTLYRECIEAGGCLSSQRQRGQLVEAVTRLGGGVLQEVNQGRELLAVLEHHLPP